MTSLKPFQIHSILVIQFSPFGDVFLTTSYFETVKRHFPDAKLTYLVRFPYQKIISNHPFIDEVMLFRRRKSIAGAWDTFKLFFKVWHRHFDLVIDQQNLPVTQQVTFFSRATYRLGYRNARLAFVYNLKADRGPGCYSASKRFDMLKPLGINPEPYRLYYDIKPSDCDFIDNWLIKNQLSDNNLITMSPGSPSSYKQWYEEGWIELVGMFLAHTGYSIIILWGPAEEHLAKSIVGRFSSRVLSAPPTDFCQAAALMKRARLLICNDGGINHLSAAVGITTIAIFGNTNPLIWSPASVFPSHHHLKKDKFDQPDPAFGISPDEVFSKALTLLSD